MAEDKSVEHLNVDYSSVAKTAIVEFDEIMKAKKIFVEYKKANINIAETVKRCLSITEGQIFFLTVERLTLEEISLVLNINEKEILISLANSNETLIGMLKPHC